MLKDGPSVECSKKTDNLKSTLRDVWTVVKYGTTDDKPNRVVYPAERNI